MYKERVILKKCKKEIDDPHKSRVGIDGVIISRGFQKGVFLPQVATETGWNLEQFMKELCVNKAGLSKDAWKGRDVCISIFQVESFFEG